MSQNELKIVLLLLLIGFEALMTISAMRMGRIKAEQKVLDEFLDMVETKPGVLTTPDGWRAFKYVWQRIEKVVNK